MTQFYFNNIRNNKMHNFEILNRAGCKEKNYFPTKYSINLLQYFTITNFGKNILIIRSIHMMSIKIPVVTYNKVQCDKVLLVQGLSNILTFRRKILSVFSK